MAIADLFASSEQGGWYNPSDLSTLWKDTAATDPVLADGDAVARIDDKSGNGNHLIQATLAARPLYRTDGTLHWLEFDGINDTLGTSAAMDLSSTDQITHAFAVETAASGQNTYAQLGGSNSAGEFGITTNASSQLSGIIYGSSATSTLWTLADIALTQKNVITQLGEISTDTHIIRCDGIQVDEDTGNLGTGNLASASTYQVSPGPNFLTGKVYQIVVRGALTSGNDLSTLESDLAELAGHTFAFESGQMIAEMFDGFLSIYTPLSSSDPDKYMMWLCEDYDTSANPAGGGVGSEWTGHFYAQRSGNVFGRILSLKQTGNSEFAMKKDDLTDENIGHEVHGGMEYRSPPVFKVDGVTYPVGTRANYSGDKIQLFTYFKCYDRTDGTTVIANLDTVKTWEDGRLKLSQTITFTADLELLTLYLAMLPMYKYFNNNDSSLGTINSRIYMPDYGGEEYTPGNGVQESYPDVSHWRTRTDHASNIGFEFEVQGSVPSSFRGWVRGETLDTKTYSTIIGQHDQFGLAAERTAYSVLTDEVFSQETWITPSLGINVNEQKIWKGAVQPAESGASGNEIKLWRGAVEPAAPVASSSADALIGGVTRSVTRSLTRGVTEGWSWGA